MSRRPTPFEPFRTIRRRPLLSGFFGALALLLDGLEFCVLCVLCGGELPPFLVSSVVPRYAECCCVLAGRGRTARWINGRSRHADERRVGSTGARRTRTNGALDQRALAG